MNVNRVDNSNNMTFSKLTIDPETNMILKPIRKQLNALATDCDVTIKKFSSKIGDYTDFGIIVSVAKQDLKSGNIIKNFLNRITEANLPETTRKIAKKCVMDDGGKTEVLFEADHDLIRTRTYKSVKSAIEEHNVADYPVINKIKAFFKKAD